MNFYKVINILEVLIQKLVDKSFCRSFRNYFRETVSEKLQSEVQKPRFGGVVKYGQEQTIVMGLVRKFMNK